MASYPEEDGTFSAESDDLQIDEEEAYTEEDRYGGDSLKNEDKDDKENEEDEEDEEDEDAPHACRYCGVSRKDCVVQCSYPNCNKWFCNSRVNTSGSHIIYHLVRAKHTEIEFHHEGLLGGTSLCCYRCGGKNIFILGFINSPEHGVVMIICREPCLASSSRKKIGWDVDNWQPLIVDRALSRWLVPEPTEKDLKRHSTLNSKQIRALEKLWVTSPNAVLGDLPADTQEFTKQLDHFHDGYHYQNYFTPLILQEYQLSKEQNDSQKLEELKIDWDFETGKSLVGTFDVIRSSFRISLQEELVVSYMAEGEVICSLGMIVTNLTLHSVTMTETSQNANNKKRPLFLEVCVKPGARFTLKHPFSTIVYDRCLYALRIFAENEQCMSSYIYHKLLGDPVEEVLNINMPRVLSAPNLAQLNPSQALAVSKALSSPFSLIQGPPGTGKTLTCATLVYQMSKIEKAGRILVVAPSNAAIDQVARRISQTGLKVVRVLSRHRERLECEVLELCLHYMLAKEMQKKGIKYNLKWKRRGKGQAVPRMTDEELLEYEILNKADVICTTCVCAADSRLSPFVFRQVLIDEATQAIEPESLIPLVKGAKQVILVGDQCQLGPTVLSDGIEGSALKKSLFERLLLTKMKPIRLEIQYRMHPSLSVFPSYMFYDGALQDGKSKLEMTYPNLDFPWPVSGEPLMFWHSSGVEEVAHSITTFLNRQEAANILQLITYLLGKGIKPEQIGVITPYDGQRTNLYDMIAEKINIPPGLIEVVIASVDSFQGAEKDFILFSCVRSNVELGLGFLRDYRRLNVAITRAKFGLIICGNAKFLGRSSGRGHSLVWSNLIAYMSNNNYIVEGAHIEKLKSIKINCTRQRKLRALHNFDITDDAVERSPLDDTQEYGRSSLLIPNYPDVMRAGGNTPIHFSTAPSYVGGGYPTPPSSYNRLEGGNESLFNPTEKYFNYPQVAGRGGRLMRQDMRFSRAQEWRLSGVDEDDTNMKAQADDEDRQFFMEGGIGMHDDFPKMDEKNGNRVCTM